MKALTLTQPFATLVAIGAKKIETRSWNTNYRGLLAIHAAKNIPTEFRQLWTIEPFAATLKGVLWDSYKTRIEMFGQSIPGTKYREFKERLNLGCVIATCHLIGCIKIPERREGFQIGRLSDPYGVMIGVIPPLEPELSFGDYTPGRYAWILANVHVLPEPIPAKGALGLWSFRPNGID